MKTVKYNTINEINVKNSRFITLLFKIDDNTDFNNIFSDVKRQYPKATHYCYAYITKSQKKSSDDKEPSGTAGVPMLNILEKENIINVLAVTVRYFGGIKLGAAGLIRAYAKSVREALTNTITTKITEGYNISLIVSYEEQKQLDYLLKDYPILNKSYLEEITYNFLLPVDKLNIISNYSYQINGIEYIEIN